MDADQIKKMNATYDGSVNSEYANIGGNRKQTFNIRRNRHYGFRVASGPTPTRLCCNPKCDKEIHCKSIIINGLIYQETCWPLKDETN
jgi:hypothetical protein